MDKPVSEVMSRGLVVVEEWKNLLDVVADMERHTLRHLPVVDGKRLVGLISHRDLLRFTASGLDRSPFRDSHDTELKAATFVGEVMTRDVTTVRPDTPVTVAAERLLASRFGCLPVVDDAGDLVGIVSEHDLLRLLVSMLKEG